MTDQRSPELDLYRDEMIRQALRPGSIDKRMSVLVRCEMAIGQRPIEVMHYQLKAMALQTRRQMPTQIAKANVTVTHFRSRSLSDDRMVGHFQMQLVACVGMRQCHFFIQFYTKPWLGWRNDIALLPTNGFFQKFGVESTKGFNALQYQEIRQ